MSMTQAQIDQAIKDQIGTNPIESLPSNPEIAQAIASAATIYGHVVAVVNGSLTSNYLGEFQDYQAEVLDGKVQPPPATTPPKPPGGWAAVKASDGWTWIIKTSDPVCPMPALAVPPTPGPAGVVAIGARIAGTNFWAALPNDTAAAGFTTPNPTTTQDGVTGFFTKVGSPFANLGWYTKVG